MTEIKKLTKNQYDILVGMTTEFCHNYSHFSDIGLDLKTLKKEMNQLREIGLVEFHRGLLDDDGKTAGSGFSLSYKYDRFVRQLILDYENENTRPMIDTEKVKEEAIKRQTIEVGEWIARRLLENRELIKTIPPLLYTYYRTWIQICEDGYPSKLYEENFKKLLRNIGY